jgi:hypothetical protein
MRRGAAAAPDGQTAPERRTAGSVPFPPSATPLKNRMIPLNEDVPDPELVELARATGPVLHMRGMRGEGVGLAVVLVRPEEERPVLSTEEGEVAPVVLMKRYGLTVRQYSFVLPMRSDGWYEVEGMRYPVNTAFGGDLRIAFVSCNGQEEGDTDRKPAERNVLWDRLAADHRRAPLNLLLHGGDQIYADEIVDEHPVARKWGEPNGDAGEGTDAATVEDIRRTLSRALFRRYLKLHVYPQTAALLARVPSLAIWDDHDICDGWGSLSDSKLDSPVGRAIFALAREHFLIFQLGGAAEALPETCIDRTGTSLGWRVALPGLHVIAPDLRSERRRTRIIGPAGWQVLDEALSDAEGSQVLLLSSVPALGPRLSLVEAVMHMIPTMQKYEDDLRDQWQSRTHRDEWQKLLRRLLKAHVAPSTRVTLLSGEIHLATRGTLAAEGGPIHQLVASGITHPPPPAAYALTLGALARLGEAPLADHPIALHPLPGKRSIYTAERNYLMLERTNGAWRTWWELEETGPTPALDLHRGPSSPHSSAELKASRSD